MLPHHSALDYDGQPFSSLGENHVRFTPETGQAD
jgi:hypothetical protein